ncbi:MAG TPA: 3-hydroxyacyl-ACP dehydratase FabZ [Candidatus Anaerobiospirillum stercoravium]|nr:3-hydroxyacyl-ACP dehydratase FabZ [Candidatus Anaerobiospirillum stercoravium]
MTQGDKVTPSNETNDKKTLDVEEIMALLPHRYPFLMIDRVVDYSITEEHKTLRAIKNVSFNEPYFQGHFPGKPVLPGVLILEAMAQATGVLAFTMVGKPEPGELYYFASIDHARFRRPVKPGDQLVIDVEYLKERRGIASFKGVATVDGVEVCSADLMCAKVRT